MNEITISEQEAALYDRQIRLWGLDAQKRLRASNVLLVGISGLGAEVAKNLVLSGIKSLTVMDHMMVTEEDLCSQFFVRQKDIGSNRAEKSKAGIQMLNPMVVVTSSTSNVNTLDEAFLESFDVVCLTNCSLANIKRINAICHSRGKLFFTGDVFGFYSFMFADLGQHDYAEDVQKKKEAESDNGSGEPMTKKSKVEMETVTVKDTCSFKRFSDTMDVKWPERTVKKTPLTYFIIRVLQEFTQQVNRKPCCNSLAEDKVLLEKLREEVLQSLGISPQLIEKDFFEYCFGELSPVCAVAGGILGQEIIKAVSRKNRPHNNFFFYNGVSGEGKVDCIG